MHPHINTFYLALVWFGCSFVNWFWVIGYYNAEFRKNLKTEKNFIWIIMASLFSGVTGFAVSIFAFKCKYWGWRPISRKQKEQILMLKKLENADAFEGTDTAQYNKMPIKKVGSGVIRVT